jgi:hypothetical protein
MLMDDKQEPGYFANRFIDSGADEKKFSESHRYSLECTGEGNGLD